MTSPPLPQVGQLTLTPAEAALLQTCLAVAGMIVEASEGTYSGLLLDALEACIRERDRLGIDAANELFGRVLKLTAALNPDARIIKL